VTGSFPVALPDPSKVSALVVGNEWYPALGPSAVLPGAARSAERFVEWLLDKKVCLPDRITLMRKVAPAGSTATRLAGREDADPVYKLDCVEPGTGLAKWIKGGHGPRESDELFLLFWVGHGFIDPGDQDKRLFLLGSDAQPDQLWNVTLSLLLHLAGEAAPDANVVAFVNACRGPIDPYMVPQLASSSVDYKPLGLAGEPDSGRWQSIAYAAAHGESTRDAGWTHGTFADDVLDRLYALPDGAPPFALFADGLGDVVTDISLGRHAEAFAGHVYFEHGPHIRRFTTPMERKYLALDEWRALVEVARAIDGDPAARPATLVRWSAYAFATQWVEDRRGPDEIETVMDLIWALSDRPPQYWHWAPPIVFASYFLANKPEADTQPALGEWCATWALHRGRDGASMLKQVEERLPPSLPLRPCLTIKVEREPQPGKLRRFYLAPVLYVMEKPVHLPEHRKIRQEEIPAAAHEAINHALESGTVGDHDDLLVEFIIPKEMHGWRFEHAGEKPLGLMYAVAIRSLDIVRHPRSGAASRIRKKFAEIEVFKPTSDVRWSDKIEWFTCEDIPKEPTAQMMSRANSPGTRFCIALGRRVDPRTGRNGRVTLPNGRVGSGSDAPMGLDHAIDQGASPFVLSVLEARGCTGCQIQGECQVKRGKRLVAEGVDAAPNGLVDLPYVARKIRSDLAGDNPGDLHFGVYMENLRHLPAEFDIYDSPRDDSVRF
jgi:hypothetical protein